MKTIEINLYKFNELDEKAKQKAIDKLSDINVDFDWWELTYSDAENIGLEITYFGLDRNRGAEGKFLINEEEVAEKIIKEHGENCQTFKDAQIFLTNFKELKKIGSKEGITDAEEEENDENIEYLKEEFLNTILEDYSIMLQNESEYLQSNESIIESIEANDCDFTKEGDLY